MKSCGVYIVIELLIECLGRITAGLGHMCLTLPCRICLGDWVNKVDLWLILDEGSRRLTELNRYQWRALLRMKLSYSKRKEMR